MVLNHRRMNNLVQFLNPVFAKCNSAQLGPVNLAIGLDDRGPKPLDNLGIDRLALTIKLVRDLIRLDHIRA